MESKPKRVTRIYPLDGSDGENQRILDAVYDPAMSEDEVAAQQEAWSHAEIISTIALVAVAALSIVALLWGVVA